MKENIVKIVLSLIIGIIALLINIMWLKIILFAISYLIVSYEVILESFENIKEGEIFGEDLLMTIASIGAFAMGEYPEAVAVMLFFKVGEMFEEYAEDETKRSISSLMRLKPDYANVKKNDEITKVLPEEVHIGDIIVVKPGERVPLDGFVLNGNALIDTSALTGESVPRTIKESDEVLSGSINTNGVLEIYVTKEFSESTISKILELVEHAVEKKAPAERFITKFAKIYTPAVITVAVTIAIIPGLIFHQDWLTWIYRALTFLVVSCPCALVISVPLSFFGGLGGESKKGILVKGSNYIELLSKIDTVVFDKTGTLTKGVFKVQKIEPVDMKNQILEIAAHAECYSNHPIACSIIQEYGREIDKNRVQDYKEISGNGISAKIDNEDIYIGNSKLMEGIGIKIANEKTVGTIVYVAKNEKYIGKIVISDEIKTDAKETIVNLKKTGVKQVIMLTGDRKEVGEKVGKELGINKVCSELLPEGKVNEVEKLLNPKRGVVAFVGDGLNDAPVLATADIGIAMGAYGTDAAVEAADAVIMQDEPSKVVDGIKIARKTMRIVKQNIVFAIGVKLLVLILGFFGLATMWEAVFADVGVTVIATLNALRTLKK